MVDLGADDPYDDDDIEPGAILYGVNLRGADLSDASLSEANLSEADLSQTDLSGADLYDADLYKADLSGADLSGATLSEANLSKINLSDATLSGANLSNTDLSEADLSDTDFSDAYVSGASLSGADLSDTNLSHESSFLRRSVIGFIGVGAVGGGGWYLSQLTDQLETSQPEATQPETSQPEATQPETSQPEATQDEATVEVLHAWIIGDGARAAEALADAFDEAHDDVTLDFNPIGGGGNQNLDAVVANRLQSNDPPGSFANWPGPNLQRYEGVLGSVDDVWSENGFEDAMIDEAIDLHKQNGSYRAVPLGSHRLNCLFYNVSVVEDAGIDVDSLNSPAALIDALGTVQSETDAIPMTHGMSGTWTTTQLWGAVMLGTNGYESYMDFIAGDGAEADVRAAFENTAEMLENYISDDAASIGLTQSNQNIVNGDAAFIHQGNWAAGAFRNAEDFTYDEDWGFKTFPGTEGMYTLHFDSFLYPSNNPTPEATKTWLSFVGSEEAQVAFNQFKGSIPTRTDVSLDEFGPFLQETAEDFAEAENRPPNIQHGLGVSSQVRTQLNEVISSEFTGPYNVDAATQGFLDAVSN